jgi:putative transposase
VLTGRPEHFTSFDYLGLHRYLLTFCTFERHPAFETLDRVDLVRTQFRRTAVEQRFAILAYCFMPDHVHLLVEGIVDDSDGLRFIKNAKQYSGFEMKLWQRYGFERVLRDEEDSLAVSR